MEMPVKIYPEDSEQEIQRKIRDIFYDVYDKLTAIDKNVYGFNSDTLLIQTPPVSIETDDSDVHTRLHDIDSTDDHNGVSGATADNLVSFDSNGLPQDSGEAASDVHSRDHGIDNTDDHDGVSGATENNLMSFDANGLPKDSGMAASDVHSRDHAIDDTDDHDGVSGATENNFMAFDANGLPKDSGHKHVDYEATDAVSTHEGTYDHSELHSHNTYVSQILPLHATASNGATYADTTVGSYWQFADGATKYVSTAINIPPDMDITANAGIRLLWFTSAQSKNCRWGVDYLVRGDDEDCTAAADSSVVDQFGSSATASGLVVTDFTLSASDIASGNDIVQILIYREGGNVSDTLSAPAGLIAVSLVYDLDV